METNVKNQNQTKSFWAMIWESMTKTGGCCGSGGSCCGPARPDIEQQKKAAQQDTPASCCSK